MRNKLTIMSATILAAGLGSISTSVLAMGCLNPNLPPMSLTEDLMKPNAAVDLTDYDKILAQGNKCPVTRQSVSASNVPQDSLLNALAPSSSRQPAQSNN